MNSFIATENARENAEMKEKTKPCFVYFRCKVLLEAEGHVTLAF